MPENVYLSTLRIFKYANGSKPECVREILCENNPFPAHDCGPSVTCFGGSIYYFKRIVKSLNDQTHQLFKFEFKTYTETKIEGYSIFEDFYSKIQFFE